MAEDEGQLRTDGVPDETLRLYLLGRLNDDERLRLDERLLLENKLAERIVLLESELTDDYAAGRLDATEQEAFVKRFLVTGDRRRQLQLTSALQDYSRSTAEASVSVTTRRKGPSWRERIAELFSLNRPAWAVAGSFAVLLLLTGLVWFVARQRHETQPLIAKYEPTPNSSPAPSTELGTSPAVVKASPEPTPIRKPAESATPAVPPTIASFVLLPGAIRGGSELTRISPPKGPRDVVRLSLIVETGAAGSYRAELATVAGQTVTVLTNLKADTSNAEARVVLKIPARLFRNGDYQIILRGKAGDQSETVARYYFRALE